MKFTGAIALTSAGILFSVFFANVSLGAMRVTPFLGDVTEMLVLLAACAAFVVCVLQKEAARDSGSK